MLTRIPADVTVGNISQSCPSKGTVHSIIRRSRNCYRLLGSSGACPRIASLCRHWLSISTLFPSAISRRGLPWTYIWFDTFQGDRHWNYTGVICRPLASHSMLPSRIWRRGLVKGTGHGVRLMCEFEGTLIPWWSCMTTKRGGRQDSRVLVIITWLWRRRRKLAQKGPLVGLRSSPSSL